MSFIKKKFRNKYVNRKIGHIVDELEVQSDVDIEYSSLMSSLAIMSNVISSVESQVLSVTSQTIRPEMLPFHNPNVSMHHFALESFALATVTASVTVKGFQIQ